MNDSMDQVVELNEPQVKKCLIIHHDDPDGKLSAAIANRLLSKYYQIDFMEVNYDINIVITNPGRYENCYILDFCPDEDTMRGLVSVFGYRNLIWIDHHESQKDIWNKFIEVSGFRDPKLTGCELTWRYFYDMHEMPIFVKLVADRDVWRNEYSTSMEFHESQIGEDTSPTGHFWTTLFKCYEAGEDHLMAKMGDLLNRGREARRKRLNLLEDIIKRSSYMSDIDGVPCLKMNYNDRSSASDLMQIMMKYADVPVAWTYYIVNRNGKFMVVNGLRGNGDVDVAAMAKKRGGGGHFSASGWVVELPTDRTF